MTTKLKTSGVAKSLYGNYLKRAEECMHAAKHSFTTREWNAVSPSRNQWLPGKDSNCDFLVLP